MSNQYKPDPATRERHKKIVMLLKKGYSVKEVCLEVSITPKRVYAVAERASVYTNPMVHHQSDDENTICRMAHAGLSISQISKYMEREPKAITRVLDRIKKDPVMNKTKERYGEFEA